MSKIIDYKKYKEKKDKQKRKEKEFYEQLEEQWLREHFQIGTIEYDKKSKRHIFVEEEY